MAVDSGPSNRAVAITPSDSAVQPVGRALFVGGAGNITGRLVNDTVDSVFNGITAGQVLPLQFLYVKATGTTCTGMIALF